MKRGILQVSFREGTALPELSEAFPGVPVYRAVLRGPSEDDVPRALERMAQAGITHATVLPLLMVPGGEYGHLKSLLHREGMMLKLARPLLWEEADLRWLLQVLQERYPREPDTLRVFLGHGTRHPAGQLFEALGALLAREPDMRLCLLGQRPDSSWPALPRATVIPLFLGTGTHVLRDMAGPGQGSLAGMLRASGYETRCVLQGLGELPAVRERFILRAMEAE